MKIHHYGRIEMIGRKKILLDVDSNLRSCAPHNKLATSYASGFGFAEFQRPGIVAKWTEVSQINYLCSIHPHYSALMLQLQHCDTGARSLQHNFNA